MISNKLKKKKQHEKELKSFRNKMGSHLVWFDSLSTKKKYDLLFLWKISKNQDKDLKSPKKVIYKRRGKTFQKIIYPINFKYWILNKKTSLFFSTSIQNIRRSAIDILLKNKNK